MENWDQMFDTMNLSGQYQPSTPITDDSSDLAKILLDFLAENDISTDNSSSGFSPSGFDQSIGSHQYTVDPNEQLAYQMHETSIDDIIKPELHHSFNMSQSQDTFFTESPDQHATHQPTSIPAGYSVSGAQEIINLTCAQALIEEQQLVYRSAKKAKRAKTSAPSPSTNVSPIDYTSYSGGCQPCITAVKLENDYMQDQLFLKHDAVEAKKIQLIGQPRSKFRPRTQTECKISAHYIRCEEKCKPEYPTIAIPQQWNVESSCNFIEVALMGIDYQNHPYTLENKNRIHPTDGTTLILKGADPNILYFRITAEDFAQGFKTFLMEYVKSRQDETITKELIATRKLEHSMLRFTRIFIDSNNKEHRDEETTEYSNVMTEFYGEVDIEHFGPQIGPMRGEEMMFSVFKGRFNKADLTIEFSDPNTQWKHCVETFTKSVNTIFFSIPAYPYPQLGRAEVTVTFYFKGAELSQYRFLYQASIDQELAALRLGDSSNSPATMTATNSMNLFDIFARSNPTAVSKSRKSTTSKATKRLKTN